MQIVNYKNGVLLALRFLKNYLLHDENNERKIFLMSYYNSRNICQCIFSRNNEISVANEKGDRESVYLICIFFSPNE